MLYGAIVSADYGFDSGDAFMWQLGCYVASIWAIYVRLMDSWFTAPTFILLINLRGCSILRSW